MKTVDEYYIRSARDIEFTHLRAYGLRREANVLRGAEERGVVNGYQRIHSTMTLSDSGDEFTVHDGQVDFLDATWKAVLSSTDEVKGKRLETP
jgi:hypothetical protein